MEEKMYVYDIVGYEKGIVYACNKELAAERVKNYYRDNKVSMNVDDPDAFNFVVWEYSRSDNQNVVVIVNY